MATTGGDPAAGLLRQFERADTTLALVEQKLESEFSRTFQAESARLNPTRLLRRLALLEAELPSLRAASLKNAAARRTILGTMAQQVANHSDVIDLARRAQAPVDADHEAFCAARECAASSLARLGIDAGVVPTGDADVAAPGADVAAPGADGPAQQPVHAPAPSGATAPNVGTSSGGGPAAADAVTELRWLRLPANVREGSTREEVSEFWCLLRGLFVRRETTHLAAAQLLALGVRTSESNSRKMRILEALGLLTLKSNAVQLVERS